ncbi:MAG TPA: hypothetical protein VIW28_10440 [Gemmatimonadales bacterium]|jgi:hypothetical protein
MLAAVTPTYKMPDPDTLRRSAVVADVIDALCVARCSAQLAGLEADEFAVRELLLTTIQHIDRAAAAVRRLCDARLI